MAREIHDTLAQGFTGVIIQAQAAELAQSVKADVDAQHHLQRVLDHARIGLSEARRSVYSLRPPTMEDGDLIRAFKVALPRIFDRVGAKHDFEVAGVPQPLGEDISIELFRIGQEALGNALRHADASTISLRLSFENPTEVHMSVRDDGRGFDLAANTQDSMGFGLISMRERAARIGGQLQILSDATGTVITCHVPLASSHAHRDDLASVLNIEPLNTR
jgi:signal transduction histidine kinase